MNDTRGISMWSELFTAVLITGSVVALCYFLYRRRWFPAFFIVFPLFLTTTVHGMFPKPFPVTPSERSLTAFSGLPICLILNTLFVAALQAFGTSDGRVSFAVKRRLGMVGFYSVLLFLNYSYIFESFGLKESDGWITHNLFTALYFTAVTWTTVGYGDVTPFDGYTRLFAAMAALNGYAVLGILIAVLVTFFTAGGETDSEPDAQKPPTG